MHVELLGDLNLKSEQAAAAAAAAAASDESCKNKIHENKIKDLYGFENSNKKKRFFLNCL
jgi:hypothetical protein